MKRFLIVSMLFSSCIIQSTRPAVRVSFVNEANDNWDINLIVAAFGSISQIQDRVAGRLLQNNIRELYLEDCLHQNPQKTMFLSINNGTNFYFFDGTDHMAHSMNHRFIYKGGEDISLNGVCVSLERIN